MAPTKVTTPQQHDMLHLHWPRSCCLCAHEATIKEQADRIKDLEAGIRALEGRLVVADRDANR